MLTDPLDPYRWQTAYPADADAVVQLVTETYRAVGVIVPPLAEYVDGWIEAGMVLVCRDHTGIWATVGISGVQDRPGKASLGGLAVRSDRQGQGRGRSLLIELASMLAEYGITTIEAVTHSTMRHAVRLYRDLGLQVHRQGGHYRITGDVQTVLRRGRASQGRAVAL